MRTSRRVPVIKSFSLRQSANFSGRNILKNYKRFGLSKSESNVNYDVNDENKSYDEMEGVTENIENESNNNFRDFREDNEEGGNFGEDDDDGGNFGDDDDDGENDDDETYEEYDFDFREEESDNFETDNNINLYEEDSIVDALTDINQMANINENTPYFENLTSTLLFCWIQKHNISTNAYNDLVDILQNPTFNANDIVKNVRKLRQWRNRLPLMPIRARPIKINQKKTPSISKETKPSYYLSIIDIIWNILNNPTLYNTLYFGPGIETEAKKEYWHGDLWAESPLFGQDEIIINHEHYHPGEFVIYREDNHRRFGRIRSIISINDELQIKIQRVYVYNELPNNFYSNARSTTQELQLWLIDQHLEEGSIIININEIVKKVNIMIIRNSSITNGLYIKEILYKNHGHWKLRNVELDYMHLSEYSTITLPPPQHNNL
ncbi:hypothetical protein RhiirA5_423612 [Rhizophagus irregularis]|uniref:Uncharacterized protein n=1 Tax=Rhizophagus irregularis TaxID=588596 RepID=A0A2N0P9R9_9GLOM|nr:hypothetical protein RhiirA5_423612 [Rhizophagus irregularis]